VTDKPATPAELRALADKIEREQAPATCAATAVIFPHVRPEDVDILASTGRMSLPRQGFIVVKCMRSPHEHHTYDPWHHAGGYSWKDNA
jgi:hypothetical protein